MLDKVRRNCLCTTLRCSSLTAQGVSVHTCSIDCKRLSSPCHSLRSSVCHDM